MRSASSPAARTTSSSATSRSRSARPRSTMASASRRALSKSSSRSLTTQRACLISSGSSLRAASMASSTSSRFTMALVESGIERASRTMSSSFCSLPRMSTGSVAPDQLVAQALVDVLRNHAGDVPAVPHDLLDQRRGQERPLGARRDEERLDARHLMIHLRHLQLVVEIRYGPNALHDHPDVPLATEVHEQS